MLDGSPISRRKEKSSMPVKFRAIDFFAGSGLVTKALSSCFNVVWANDISERKAAVYVANHGRGHFLPGDVKNVKGFQLPETDLAWASFPCQDLSLAGKIAGIHASRSGLVWEWLRVIDELASPPPLLVAENVQGLISSQKGQHYIALHKALVERGYNVGATLLDASFFVPQSRPRIFVVAVKKDIPIRPFRVGYPTWLHELKPLQETGAPLKGWVWWNMPYPPERTICLEDVIERNAPFPSEEWQKHNLEMIPLRSLQAFLDSRATVAAGYRRIRNGQQVLEIRIDGLAGCLRTPSGGSSKQILIIKTEYGLNARFLTGRETARLMGVSDSYKLPGTYLDIYAAMGDAVALPAVEYLARNLLHPLAKAAAMYAGKYQKAV
jgi:DNA (cytosine-5)-methyltransferase 1